ncbi:hypothetical protein ACHAXR_013277 [Thalassiosira sp. AJA248-18]
MDAALDYFMDAYPSLLLLPREPTTTNNDNNNTTSTTQSPSSSSPPPSIINQISTILTFQTTLLRSATSKHLYSSVPHLSSLLASSSDTISHKAIETLAALAMPPMLHRQQAPEISQHTTQLHNLSKRGNGGSGGSGGGSEVMERLVSLARGWGTKGSGLGLLQCVEMDDDIMMDLLEEDDGGGEDANDGGKNANGDGKEEDATMESAQQQQKKKQQSKSSFLKCAGEIFFECYCHPNDDEESSHGGLISLHVSKEEMYTTTPSSSPTTASSSINDDGDDVEEEKQAEKRRKIATTTPSGNDDDDGASTNNNKQSSKKQIKSTARLYQECLDKIQCQLEEQRKRSATNTTNDTTTNTTTNNKPISPTKILPPHQQFTLLAQIRSATSFHTSRKTRHAAISRRLSAITCLVHGHSSQECVGAYFMAQPELVGELVDLLRPTVDGERMAGGVLLDDDNKVDGGEQHTSTTSSTTLGGNTNNNNNTSILALSDSPHVPYTIRTLALETLTALVARRDPTGGMLTNVARQTNVLSELGVGKGQYLGLLPTLIRYSLAVLNSFLLSDDGLMMGGGGGGGDGGGGNNEAVVKIGDAANGEETPKDIGLELGLAFLKATKPPPPPKREREERALEFIDAVLTLTSAVISVPSGTASLTDCGIIPALVSTIALDGQMARRTSGAGGGDNDTSFSSSPFCNEGINNGNEESYSDCLLKFISAQAIQILEGAIVTHNSALSAFHELKGVDVLVQRLNVEVEKVRGEKLGLDAATDGDVVDGGDNAGQQQDDGSAMVVADPHTPAPTTTSASLATTTTPPHNNNTRTLRASRRVLLFSAVNCLTVVFHQHESGNTTPNNPNTPSGGAQLRKPELKHVLLEIMDNVDAYGGVLAALVATFLSDVMNSDPQVVHYVHESGLAKSFLSILSRSGSGGGADVLKGPVSKWDEYEPLVEPSPELIMALPNVITALSLTEAGAKEVAEANPFPALFSIFCSPKYVMPHSRCLLNEMAAIVGTGLDELMRHNPPLRSLVLSALVKIMNRVAHIGKELLFDEDNGTTTTATPRRTDLDTARTELMQYSYNLSQLLEQILHNEDHIAPFVTAGGFDSLLDLVKWTVAPGGRPLVAHVTCLSGPPVGAGAGPSSTASGTLSALVRTVVANTVDPHKLIKNIIGKLDQQLIDHGRCVVEMDENNDHEVSSMNCKNMLENIPNVALHSLTDSTENSNLIHSLSSLFRSLIHIDWLTQSLASSIRAACQRSNELVLNPSREREWKKEIASPSFKTVVDKLSLLYRSSMWEVCRIRTQSGFDERDEVRNRKSERPLVYKIRIVCQEGAIVRNGIDIDRCDNVGNLEMGEIVHAYDRCINSSGVLRYQTSRGWVSELTRGHGRENITQILDVTVGDAVPPLPVSVSSGTVDLKRIECGVPDLRSVGASVLARLHGSQSGLFSSLERLMVSGIRSPTRSLSFQQNVVVESHVMAATKLLSSNLKANLEYASDENDGETTVDTGDGSYNPEALLAKNAAKCMYLGNQLNLLYASLCEEKRDRRIFNVPLLLNLLVSFGDSDTSDDIYSAANTAGEQHTESTTSDGGVMSAIRFVLMHSLGDMAQYAAKEKESSEERDDKTQEDARMPQHNALQRMSRAVASSLPPTLSLLRRLISRPLLVESQMSTALAKMKAADFVSLISNHPRRDNTDDSPTSTSKFNTAQFTRALHLKLAKLSNDVWSDERFSSAPSHVVHPILTYMGEVIRSLEEAAKVVEPAPVTTATERLSLSGGGRLRDLQDPTSRSGRILASMGLLRDPAADVIERQISEPFEPSEEAISRLAEMGFGRDHALEALENVGSNRVEVAMEYALNHPPSSPGTLERRRADREQRRLERQRQIESERESSTNEDLPSQADVSSNTLGTQNNSSDSNSPNNNKEEPKPKPPTEDELKAEKEKEIEEKLATEAKEYLQTMKESLCKICLNIIEGSVTGEGETGNLMVTDSDSQGVIVVVSNFLLDITRGYPALESNIASELLQRLKSQLDVKSPSHCRVKSGCEYSFAALAHASVVLFKSRPTVRPLVLRHGLVGMITHCVRNCTLTSAISNTMSPMVWPRWLAPALLLLEVMAQPTSITLDIEEAGQSKPANKKSEYGKVLAYRKKHTALVAKTTKSVFSTVMSKEVGKVTPKKRKEMDSKKQSDKKTSDTPVGDTGKQKAQPPPLPSIPTFLPLLHSESAEACMMLCLQLLGLKKSKKGVIDKVHLDKVCPPPVIVNAILVLLVRVLRSRQLAASCLAMGAPELLLSLPSRSYFPSNYGIINVLLRRMLEDEITLHTMMDTELRSIAAKIYKKQHPSHSASVQPKVNLKAFMQACSPLIMRDELVFLKAIACSVKIAPPGSETTSSLTSSRGCQVTLLSSEQRMKNAKLLGLHSASNGNNNDASAAEKPGSQEDQLKQSRGRSKSPHRASLGKKSTPTTKTACASGSAQRISKNHCQLNGTPANHITSLLLKEIVATTQLSSNSNHKQPFLTTLDYLGILSDLVLAIPACGAAIHRFKPPKDMIIHNAITGCPDPPQTAVSYLLHKLLPQPRSAPKQVSGNTGSQKMLAFNKTKTSQAAARLMVCLVARSGEGRRRVISDLVFALSCGKYPIEKKSHNPGPVDSSQLESSDCNAKMWALKSWGELCMGLSAPRSSNAVMPHQDSNSLLSFEVVKLMLDFGAAHALMVAIERISLHHPMASTVASALVRPLEIFTRGSVYTTLNDMAEKEKAKLDAAKSSRRITFGPSHQTSFADDAALDNAFDADGADIQGHSLDESMENSDADDDDGSDESMEGMSDEDGEIEVPPIDYSDNDSDDGSSEEEISSDSSSDMEDDEIDDESDEEILDEDAGDELFSEGSDEEEVEGDWGLENDDFFDGNVEDEVNNSLEGDAAVAAAAAAAAAGNEDDGMEGWTRVDGGRALGSMLLDMVQPHGNGRQNQMTNGGFLMDAAEHMLGNMLRGDTGLEGLSEIEDTLGIRVVRGERGDGRGGAGHMGRANPTGTAGNGGRPAVHQNNSNNGSSIFGARGGLVEFSPMEFVYGYDLLLPPNEGDHSREPESPSTYDTQLFPGGIAASTHSRSQPNLHPLLQSIQLPPINSLRATLSSHGENSNSPQGRTSRSIAASGSYIAGSNGNIIRVNDRFLTQEGPDRLARRTANYPLAGWVDDGLPPDRATEDLSIALGEAIVQVNSLLQEQITQNTANSLNEDNSGESEEQGRTATENAQNESEALGENLDHADTGIGMDEPAEETETQPAEEMEVQPADAPGDSVDDDAAESNDEPPPAQESQSGAAEVSSAMAAGLTISQRASDNAPTPPNPSDVPFDQATTRTDSDNAEVATDAVMAEEHPVEGGTEENTEENADDEVPVDDDQAPEDVALEEGGAAPEEGGAPDESEENVANNDELANEENDTSTQELICPPDIDPEVFQSLPLEMQQEIVQQHEVEAQISGSGLDPEALAALPEEMRREIIEQEQQEQRLREQQAAQPAADPANAEDMDNASFLASLAPDLRQEILLTADDEFISSLPTTLIAEANVLRERVASQQRRRAEETNNASNNASGVSAVGSRPGGVMARPAQPPEGHASASRGRRQRNGKLRVESDRKEIVYNRFEDFGPLLTRESARAFLSLLYLLSPVQPQRIIHKLMLNMCMCDKSREFFLNALIGLAMNDKKHVLDLLEKLNLDHKEKSVDQSDFPPFSLIGVTADLVDDNNSRSGLGFRRRQGENSASAVTVAASLPASARGLSKDGSIPPVVARRIISLCSSLCKTSPRVAFSMLSEDDAVDAGTHASCLENLLDLIGTDQYAKSATSLEQLLALLEIVVAPLSLLPKDDQEIDVGPSSPGREWVRIPRVVISTRRLHLLINTLRLESCKDSSFLKVNTLTRRLSRVEANRACILNELALVAEGLGKAALLDLKAVSVRLNSAAKHHQRKLQGNGVGELMQVSAPSSDNDLVIGTPSSAVSLSTSNSELKLLRVLQMLNSLCTQDDEAKTEGNPPEFVSLLHSLKLESLWDQLSVCLKTVSVLEGCNIDVDETEGEGDDEENENNGKSGKKLQNSVAGLITRFLPAIEAFFMVNACSPQEESDPDTTEENSRVVQFAIENKILLNALLRSNPQLLEKGLRAMVKMPRCRPFLDFDVKRQWFKTQVRRMRQQASRRHGSFRLNLRRKHVFEDSFHAFIHRNADELRGRLHITFINEEGVDAGGLSREFFAILAKEMFNPNYALFMSTEDGCTFQPNPNSSINPDDLRYFRFVGRIVGKAVVDGFLLDAHFTRSLYKHMLGVKPTHHDMQAIDPDYYKNLQMVLQHKLEDIGLELTFSTEDHSFGRSQTINLIPDGRNIPVTEENKERYVDLVCQHRITTSIEKQIKAFLEGFHEMVDRDLISIFTAKELELLISGMPDIDIHDLKKNTDYNGYRPADKEIGWFWNIMFALTRSEKASFLQFVTGSSKVPLAGFSELQGMRGVQKFSINKASGPAGALMSAHTCFNALDLPVYNSEEEMKEKLLYAISEGSGGFGFA